jgi:hypothetical protein
MSVGLADGVSAELLSVQQVGEWFRNMMGTV